MFPTSKRVAKKITSTISHFWWVAAGIKKEFIGSLVTKYVHTRRMRDYVLETFKISIQPYWLNSSGV